jgi:hypothetical protein
VKRVSVTPAEDRQPLMALIGGPRGALESILPPLVFVAVYIGLGDENPDSLTWRSSPHWSSRSARIWRLLERATTCHRASSS